MLSDAPRRGCCRERCSAGTSGDPIVSEPNVFSTPPEDQYKKGALFLNTVRSVMYDDAKCFKLLHDYYQHFKYQTRSQQNGRR